MILGFAIKQQELYCMPYNLKYIHVPIFALFYLFALFELGV